MPNGCLVINIVGPENVGKNAFGSALVLMLQRFGERAEFVNKCSDLTVNDIYDLGIEMSKKFDFVIMNGGLSYHLGDYETENYVSNSLKDNISYFTVVLNPSTNIYNWSYLESELYVYNIRGLLDFNKMYFIQLFSEYSSDQLSKVCRTVLLYCTFCTFCTFSN